MFSNQENIHMEISADYSIQVKVIITVKNDSKIYLEKKRPEAMAVFSVTVYHVTVT